MSRLYITLEFALALPDSQRIETQKFQAGITLKEALPFFALYHEAIKIIDQPKFGIFNQIVEDDYELKDGDRIEVYRPLIIDPKQARRIRAEREAKRAELERQKERSKAKRKDEY